MAFGHDRSLNPAGIWQNRCLAAAVVESEHEARIMCCRKSGPIVSWKCCCVLYFSLRKQERSFSPTCHISASCTNSRKHEFRKAMPPHLSVFVLHGTLFYFQSPHLQQLHLQDQEAALPQVKECARLQITLCIAKRKTTKKVALMA